MKSEFLKIAGVKSDKAFYKKYPTEAAFFKAHPEAKKQIKKAQFGDFFSSFSQNMQNVPDMQAMIQSQTQSGGVNASMFPSSTPDYNKEYMNMSLADEQLKQPKPSAIDQISKFAGPAGQIIGGIQAIKEGKKKKKEAEMWAKVTGLQAQAAESTDVDDLRQYTENAEKKRRAFMPEMTGEEFFPVYGVGTNVLARNGARLEGGGMVGGNPTEIQNTYGNGNSLYDNLEYEPLYNVNQIKSYQSGGRLHQMQNGGYSNSQDYYNQIINAGKSTGIISGGDVAGGAAAGGAGGATPWGAIGGMGSGIAGSMTGNDGGGQIGGTIGGTAGFLIGGPAGQAIGQTLGTLAGGLLDTNDRDQRKAEEKIKNNRDRMMTAQNRTNLQQQYGSYMRDGGYMNPEYNPQVITMFGDVNDQDFADFAHKHEFRAGGHLKSYTPPSERAMQTYAMGGELETHWGGYAEPMSENPYLPGTGETVMFRGKSHDESDGKGNTGIGITYGDNPVEVERGEPATKLRDGSTGEDSLVVYGNLMIPDYGVEALEDKNAKGKKFKNYVADLSKTEAKQNKLIEKSTDELNSLDVRNSFDRLKLSALEASIKGGNMKLKSIADKKIKAADLQNAINETAEEYGVIADDLAKGKVKFNKEAVEGYAKFGTSIPKAQGGIKAIFNSDKEALDAGYKKVGNEYIKVKQSTKKTTTEKKTASAMDNIPIQKVDKTTGLGNVTPAQFEAYKKENDWYPDWDTFDPKDPEDVDRYAKAFNAEAKKRGSAAQILPDDKNTGKVKFVGEQLISSKLNTEKEESPIGQFEIETAEVKQTPGTKEVPYKRNKLIDIFGEILPFIRPTDQEELNPNQLMGEMYAMSNNQVEPVQATPYSPQLRVPYDISRNAAKNNLISQTRAAQRMVGYNPAAQANIAAQAYNPMQQLNELDFVDNQRMKDQVYSGNIQTLNDAELKNLAIYDEQYKRQAQGLSNTKATAQAVLNSISDKYAKNALENKTLGVMENMYNYRYDNRGRAINMNAPFQPNIPTVGSMAGTQRQVPVRDAAGNVLYYQLETYDPSANGGVGTPPINAVSKNGKSITKNNKNSSVVRAYKNL